MWERTVRIYTLLMTVTDEDRGLFQSTTEHGSFLSPRLAQWEMEQLIAQERTNLGAVYDCEERTDTAWEAYEAGNAASHLVRIEIVTSLLRLPSAGKDAGLEMDLLQETAAIQSSSVEQRLEQVDRLYQLQMELCHCLEGMDFDMPAAPLDMVAEGCRLLYRSLVGKLPRYLAIVGRCSQCGKTVAINFRIPDTNSTDALFRAVWCTLKQEANDAGLEVPLQGKEQAARTFTALFHAEDRPAAQAWFCANVEMT